MNHTQFTAAFATVGMTVALITPSNPAPSSAAEARIAYGRAVAIAGDFAFVGEPNVGGGGGRGGGGRGGAPPASGTVYVFRRGETGWRQVDTLKATMPESADGFGTTLAAEGTTLFVGQVRPSPVAAPAGRGGRGAQPVVPAEPPPPDTAVGTVQVFRRGADMKWKAAGSLVGAQSGGAKFGTAIALAGNVALVGAPGEPAGGTVYLYTRATDGSWSPGGMLPAQGVATGDRFGTAIAIDKDRIVVGAPSRRVKGAIFIFARDSAGAWQQQSEQVAPANLPDAAQFGAAVAVTGNRVVAGAPGVNFTPPPPNPVRDSLLARLPTTPPGVARDSLIALVVQQTAAGGRGGRGGGGGGGRGGAQVGLGTGMVIAYELASFGSWRMMGTLAPFDFGNVNFGSSINVVGGELWIGAPGSDGAGRIYRARADRDGMWTSMTKLGVDTIETGAQWAAAFAVSGNSAIVGMPGDGAGGGTVAFMGRTPTGAWTLQSMHMPPIPERFPAVAGASVKCTDGKAAAFDCNATELLSYMPLSAIGAKRGVRLSGSWGWTDPVTGRDIALIGRTDGTAFVDVTNPSRPRYLGDLMRTKGASMSSWREMKTYKNYALIVSDGSGDRHGVQIFDLTRLRGVTTPRRFTEDAHFDAGSIHDIAVNEESGFAYALGTSSGGERCSGGSLIIDMKNPLKPAFAGCFADVGTGRSRGGYTHDAQCVIYKGPDARYKGHEICMAANETTVSIQDVTDKKNIKVLSHADYPTPGYTHQGWFTEDQRFWYLNDELDEGGQIGRAAEGTRTMIFDVSDLQQPVMVKEHIGPTRATDHNLYVKGDRMYQSNYLAGLRILDISDPTNPKEIGSFDTTPGENTSSMSGSWNNYPFFKNGAIGIVSMGEGFFMVKDVVRRIMQ
jgi:choice-of-anchor B domain-containing protein